MSERKTFDITWDEFVSLSFELLFLIESHRSICVWLGPYEVDDASCRVSSLYREKFEGKLSSLLISIASNLRIMEDLGKIGGRLVGVLERDETFDSTESQVFQSGVGELIDEATGKTMPLVKLRDLLNTVMHSDRIEFGISEMELSPMPALQREVKGFDNIVIVSTPRGKNQKIIKTVRLNLLNFARYLFDIVEELEPDTGSRK